MSATYEYLQYALELGFTRAACADGLTLQCKPDLRAFCNKEQCTSFGTSWVCPPGCGTLEDCQNRLQGFQSGIVLQSVYRAPSAVSSQPKLKRLQHEHNMRFLRLADQARSNDSEVLPLTTGGCIICETCTYPAQPCREPARQFQSLSAHGIDVAALCGWVGFDFSFREDQVTYIACLLVNKM